MRRTILQVLQADLPQWVNCECASTGHVLPAVRGIASIAVVTAAALFLQCSARAQSLAAIVSDQQTEYSLDGVKWSPSVLAWVHSAWPPLTDASWVWKSEYVTPQEAADGSKIVTFRRKFVLPQGMATTRADLRVAADNAYEVSLNGKILGHNGTLDASANDDEVFKNVGEYPVDVQPGENELVIRAINYHWQYGANPTAKDNPAGVVFRLTMPVPAKPVGIRITADKDPFPTVDMVEIGESFSVELTYFTDPGVDPVPIAIHTTSGGDLKTTAARVATADGSPLLEYRTGSIRLTAPP